mmetsp:Transcript_3650/g.7463  ORF Transcript_3650/g.7463 Transcript_3650/m.7463 type:complete len:573 (+) Transcript_3650:163-1881(+)
MGKHNGKARRTGKSVGSALVNKARKEGKFGAADSYLYTTENPGRDSGLGIQSIIHENDLDNLMSMAELADRDFSADRGQAVVIKASGSTSVTAQEAARTEEERVKAEEENAHKLCVPRRPPWNSQMTVDELDAQERAYFLEWRRSLAELETSDYLVLTPFEKNLNVWRQLWRVIERSDVVVQVVDARDPLTYWNEDLKRYCLELNPTKTSILLMNKSDMVPEKLRSAWADYFDSKGMDYIFWSAKAASEEEASDVEGSDPRVRLYMVDELVDVLKEKAAKAVKEQKLLGLPRMESSRYMVGLIGYPNVGKSSTINAVFGSKKTAVAATPGKTKHFQTLFVSDELCLCDCPGLVMPRFAKSKADMVAAGVIPIDRLTDVIEPVDVIASRIKKEQLEAVYGMKIKQPAAQVTHPLARSLLYSIAASRGWSGPGGLPDVTRAGRRLLKDYVDGKVLACKAPPGASEEVQKLARDACPPGCDLGQIDKDAVTKNDVNGANVDDGSVNTGNAVESLDDDGGLLENLNFMESKVNGKPIRPAYKFHKKTKAKSRAAVCYGSSSTDEEMSFGKKGGLKR